MDMNVREILEAIKAELDDTVDPADPTMAIDAMSACYLTGYRDGVTFVEKLLLAAPDTTGD